MKKNSRYSIPSEYGTQLSFLSSLPTHVDMATNIAGNATKITGHDWSIQDPQSFLLLFCAVCRRRCNKSLRQLLRLLAESLPIFKGKKIINRARLLLQPEESEWFENALISLAGGDHG